MDKKKNNLGSDRTGGWMAMRNGADNSRSYSSIWKASEFYRQIDQNILREITIWWELSTFFFFEK